METIVKATSFPKIWSTDEKVSEPLTWIQPKCPSPESKPETLYKMGHPKSWIQPWIYWLGEIPLPHQGAYRKRYLNLAIRALRLCVSVSPNAVSNLC